MRIGYARVSTEDQDLSFQIEALKKASCQRIIQEKRSGTNAAREGLEEAKKILRLGDVFVIHTLDRLGRKLDGVLKFIAELQEIGVDFIVLKNSQFPIDTTSAFGKFVLQIQAAAAELERNMISERTSAGLKAARARGRCGGRPKVAQKKQRLVFDLYESRRHTIKEICEIAGVSPPTVYKYIKALGAQQN